MAAYTREEGQRELQEVERDLAAFKKAAALIETRLAESRDSKRIHKMEHWTGTHASLGVLHMAIKDLNNLRRDWRELTITAALGEGFGESRNEC